MALTPLLIADDFHPSLMRRLEAAGISYTYEPKISAEQVQEALRAGLKALVVRSKIKLSKEVLSEAHGLKMIARGGAGMDNVDEEFANEHGIFCLNAGEANSDAVGEHTVGMLLSLLHKISSADAEVRRKIWNRESNRGVELRGKNVGIIGFGNTGSAVADKLIGFGVNVFAHDKYKTGFGNDRIKEASLQEIFENADIVTIHVPLDSHTKFMVNSQFIQRFVRKFYLLNLSRGGVVKTEDVLEEIKKGKIIGFAADVLEHEDPQQMGEKERLWFEKLTASKNVVLTPHVAGWTAESYIKISEVLAEKICRKWPEL